MDEQLADLVFEGGGVKGIGLAGAFAQLEQRGYRPRCVAGTSAGAITAALVAAGYTGQELVKAVEEMPFEQFCDEPRLHLLGPIAEVAELLSKRGLHSGNFFLQWMREMLAAKGKRTFGDLRNPAAPDNAKQQHLLQVIASDLTEHSMLVLPRDAQLLGIEPDDLEAEGAEDLDAEATGDLEAGELDENPGLGGDDAFDETAETEDSEEEDG